MMLAHVLYLPQLVRILSCILLGRASDRQMLMRYSLKLHASKTCLRHTQNLVLLAYLVRSHGETYLREGSSDESFARGVSSMTDSKGLLLILKSTQAESARA